MISLRSKITQKALEYFFLNPHARLYVQELARVLHVDPKNLHRKLLELEEGGVLKSEFSGKQRYFFINRLHPLLKEYRNIILKTILESRLRSLLSSVAGIKEVYIFGSYAGNKMNAASDIDILAVGNHSSVSLQRALHTLQKEIGREINAVSMGQKEFAKKKKKGDPFIKNIFSGKYLQLL